MLWGLWACLTGLDCRTAVMGLSHRAGLQNSCDGPVSQGWTAEHAVGFMDLSHRAGLQNMLWGLWTCLTGLDCRTAVMGLSHRAGLQNMLWVYGPVSQGWTAEHAVGFMDLSHRAGLQNMLWGLWACLTGLDCRTCCDGPVSQDWTAEHAVGFMDLSHMGGELSVTDQGDTALAQRSHTCRKAMGV